MLEAGGRGLEAGARHNSDRAVRQTRDNSTIIGSSTAQQCVRVEQTNEGRLRDARQRARAMRYTKKNRTAAGSQHGTRCA